MQRNIVITADGSTTIHLPEWNEQYHSKHGAIQEAYHVFINRGLRYVLNSEDFMRNKKPIFILEIGFGTGLNAFITLLEAEKLHVNINYTGVEGYPVSLNEVEQLNYTEALHVTDKNDLFKIMHSVSWEAQHVIIPQFKLTKQQKLFHQIKDNDAYTIIYFDAFGARVQPELWTEAIFKNMFNALKSKGVLVTYSAKGSVRRAMQAAGFFVERLPGPLGKREMLRGIKCDIWFLVFEGECFYLEGKGKRDKA